MPAPAAQAHDGFQGCLITGLQRAGLLDTLLTVLHRIRRLSVRGAPEVHRVHLQSRLGGHQA
jgi:hypothetical protein